MSDEFSENVEFNQLLDFCNNYVKPITSKKPFMISIDGNIGAGKTTLLQKLSQVVDPDRVVIVYEPVKKWTELIDLSDGMSLLQKYYTYPNMYSFMFQTVIFQTIIPNAKSN